MTKTNKTCIKGKSKSEVLYYKPKLCKGLFLKPEVMDC